MEEEKKYLVNIEDNLDEYAKRADNAAMEVAELKAKISGLTDEQKRNGPEVEKLNAQLRTAQKEYNYAKKAVDQATAANKAQSLSYNQLYQQWQLAQTQLKNMSNAYVLNKNGVYELSDAYKKQSKIVADTKAALDQFGKGVHDNRLNVGSYEEALQGVSTNIISMGKNLIGAGAIIGGLTAIFNKLKEAVMSTTFAIDAMNQVQAISKQLFYDLALTGQINIDNLKNASKAQSMLNDIRAEEIRLGYTQATQQKEINEQRLIAADQTKTDTERMEALNRVKAIDEQQTKDKLDLLKRELMAITQLREGQEDNEELLKEQYRIMTEIRMEQAKSDSAMKEIESQRSGILKKQMEDWKARNTYLKEGTAEYAKAQDELAKLIVQEYELAHAVKVTKDEFEAAAKAAKDFMMPLTEQFHDYFADAIQSQKDANIAWQQGMDEAYVAWRANKADQSKYKQEQDAKDIEDEKNKQQIIGQVINAAYQGIQKGADAIFESKRDRLNAEMTAELSNVDLTEQQKLAIKKKYFEQQKKSDLTQAIINGALSISNALATTKPFIPAGLIAGGLAAIESGIQIATIKSQKFEGGTANVKQPNANAQVINKAVAQPVGASVFAQTKFQQQELNQLPEFNLTAEDIANAIRKIPAPRVAVDDIRERMNEVDRVEVRANV